MQAQHSRMLNAEAPFPNAECQPGFPECRICLVVRNFPYAGCIAFRLVNLRNGGLLLDWFGVVGFVVRLFCCSGLGGRVGLHVWHVEFLIPPDL